MNENLSDSDPQVMPAQEQLGDQVIHTEFGDAEAAQAAMRLLSPGEAFPALPAPDLKAAALVSGNIPRPGSFHDTSQQRPDTLPAVVAGAFERGNSLIDRYLTDPRFISKLPKRDGDGEAIIDRSKLSYWRTFSKFVSERTDDLIGRGAPDELGLRATAMLAAAPQYLIEQRELDATQDDHVGFKRVEGALLVASGFNGLIRSFAEQAPGLRVSSLRSSLVGMIKTSLGNDRQTIDYASDAFSKTIYGAQHETAFAQVLKESGRKFRAGNPEEDVEEGADFIVTLRKGVSLHINVKASSFEINQRGEHERPYLITRQNERVIRVLMWSLISKNEIGDKFGITDDSAKFKAEILNDSIDEIENISPYT